MASVPALQMKERAAKAYAAMEALELSRQTITPILKQLLKTYNNEWDFIEAENYRLLADAAFEQQEAQMLQQTSKKAPNGPVTRARRVNFEVDAGYEDLSDRSPLSGSPAGSRADTACPVNVAQGIEYHSGMNVRSRAVGRIEQGSRGTRGRLAVTNSATAAHGLDKGKSPLVADSPSTFRDSRWGESGNTGYVPKLVSVKLEATGVVAEGFEKVSFERVDGVIVPAVRKLQNSAVTAIKNIDCGTHPLLKRVKLEVCEEQPMTKNLNGSTHAPCIEKGGEARFLGPEAADGCGHQDITSGCTSSHLLMITAGSSVEQQPMEEDDGTVFTSLVDYESEGEFPDPVQEDSGKPVQEQRLVTVPQKVMVTPREIIAPIRDIVPFVARGNGVTKTLLKRVKVEPGMEGPSDQAQQPKKRKLRHDPTDISRGTERVAIPFVNDFTSETIPRNFQYIVSNTIFQAAYINIALARVGDEDCCRGCIGDCLSAPHDCPCTRETGGEFAYTREGLLRPEYIKEEVDRSQDPAFKNKLTYCQWDCPIERAKTAMSYQDPDSCKGHVLRKFVKECWHKCGCGMQCGNRVVQRGISRKLQVFFTNKGKGWGIRTTEELPSGAFVCEYVGEILTNMELDKRNQEMKEADIKGHKGEHKDTYPVLLDGDWCSERGLKDEEALCLDATNYGNVARFINHRCFDANLIDIPVTIESQDRHYYHVAFFTNRHVSAGEELTWDYKIDFEDNDHPIEAFRCLCGSELCRGGRTGGLKKHKK